MPEAHPCSGPICSKGPWGPSMPRDHPCQGHLSLPSAKSSRRHMWFHPCRMSINAQGPSMSRAIHAEGPSMPKAHLCLGLIHLEGPWKPIHAEGIFISRAHGGPSMPWRGPNPVQGAFIPRAHGSLSIPSFLHAEGPSLPREHPSQGPMGAHPYLGPIHGEGPTLRRVHPSRGPVHA